jgi:hypothetical protein
LGGVIVLLASSPGLLLLSTNPRILYWLTGWPLYTLKRQNNKKKGHPEGVSYTPRPTDDDGGGAGPTICRYLES